MTILVEKCGESFGATNNKSSNFILQKMSTKCNFSILTGEQYFHNQITHLIFLINTSVQNINRATKYDFGTTNAIL
jgi:hypothetical protein